MSSYRFPVFLGTVIAVVAAAQAQTPARSSSSPSSSSVSVSSKPARSSSSEVTIDTLRGAVANGVYRNNALTFSCRIPAGWVLRTEEMNQRGEASETGTSRHGIQGSKGESKASSGTVLLAAFSRPPEARGEDVNASILIAAENATVYPGMKDAVQYFGPVTEVAKAQGFEVDEEPYEFALGARKLARSDFEKNVGTRVMRQSTLVVLERGYVVSFTFIGGTEDEMEELVQGLSFGAGGKSVK